MDISSLRERPGSSCMSVSELNSYIKAIFDNNSMLRAISVSGEISNFVRHRSGHLYFSLKDDGGQIRAVMFSSSAQALRFEPENGMKVVVRGSVSVYAKDGSYQLYVKNMQPDGVGALYLAYERLKARLADEGLFDEGRKQLLPQFPEKIGVVTSPTGAAVRDIINILGRRYPLAKVYIYPALVQGESAEPSLIKGIDYFDKSGLVDVVIIGRGGGSIEDLWAFNGEALARRIASARVPIVSAVGHETDFTICDFVADMRAPTPSAAAELCVPDIGDIIIGIDNISDRCDRAIKTKLDRFKDRLSALSESRAITEPSLITSGRREALGAISLRAQETLERLISVKRNSLSVSVAMLEGLSPLAVLSRGYSIAERKGVVIREARVLSPGDKLTIRFADGARDAEIIE